MAQHNTHKRTTDGKRQTLARRRVRAVKGGATMTTRSGRAKRSTAV